MTRARPVVVLGPTASGKSEVAMAVAARLGTTEIVACDAMQVYRGMDIGTAKPTVGDRAAVAHHCLDLVEHTERFTVSDYQTAANDAIQSIAAHGRTPLVVAGTGLYLTSIVDGLEFPGEYPDVRAELEAEPDTAALLARLIELDPVSAARIEHTNRRRIVRALEVCIGSGRPFSATGPGMDAYPETDVVQVGLLWPRERLAERIERRVHAMMDAGLLDEVRGLLARGAFSATSCKALGYAELAEHLSGRMSLVDAVSAIVTHTRQFAVRQERWFRRDPRIRWVEVEQDPVAEVAPVVIGVCE